MIHQSAANATEDPRWAMLIAFDTVHNAQFYRGDRSPAELIAPELDDSCVLEYGAAHLRALEESGGERGPALEALAARL